VGRICDSLPLTGVRGDEILTNSANSTAREARRDVDPVEGDRVGGGRWGGAASDSGFGLTS